MVFFFSISAKTSNSAGLDSGKIDITKISLTIVTGKLVFPSCQCHR